MALAETYYGPIPRRDVPDRVRAQEPRQLAPRRVVLSDSRVAHPSLRRTYLAPRPNSEDSSQAAALRVFATVLGGGTVSRLYQELVVRQKIALSAGAFYDAVSLDPSLFGIYATPASGHTPEELEQAIDRVLQDVLRDGLDDEEIERAKAGMVASVVYARDSIFRAPRVLGDAMTAGLSVTDVETWPDLVSAVTSEQVLAAGRAVLDPRRSVTGYLLPES